MVNSIYSLMKLTRFHASLSNLGSEFSLRTLLKNGILASLYSTSRAPQIQRKPWICSRNSGSMDALYRRINAAGDEKFSIIPVLGKWLKEGFTIHKAGLREFIKELRRYKRYSPALEVLLCSALSSCSCCV